jgi:FkbM family methyltransferase
MEIVKDHNHKADIEILFANHTTDKARKGIIHVGAHKGEEVETYIDLGFENIILIEPNPELYQFLSEKFKDNTKIKVFGVAISDCSGVMDFHIHTSQSGSVEPASLLKMKEFNKIVKTLKTVKTISVAVITLDDFFVENKLSIEDYNYINIDVQGAELMAFKGATNVLKSIDVVISEVNLIELYENAPLEKDIVNYLKEFSFEKKNVIYHTLYDDKGTFPAWGECLFLKTGL